MLGFKYITRINNEPSAFYFQRIYTFKGIKYFATVKLSNKKIYSFTMENKDGNWKIINAPQIPEQILHIENELVKFIKYQENIK